MYRVKNSKGLKFAAFAIFREHLNGERIFRRGHSSYFFELPGKIVDGSITQRIGNLGEIHVLFPDHLFGTSDFHTGEIFHNAAVAFVAEKFLKLGNSNHVIMADLFQG